MLDQITDMMAKLQKMQQSSDPSTKDPKAVAELSESIEKMLDQINATGGNCGTDVRDTVVNLYKVLDSIKAQIIADTQQQAPA